MSIMERLGGDHFLRARIEQDQIRVLADFDSAFAREWKIVPPRRGWSAVRFRLTRDFPSRAMSGSRCWQPEIPPQTLKKFAFSFISSGEGE